MKAIRKKDILVIRGGSDSKTKFVRKSAALLMSICMVIMMTPMAWAGTTTLATGDGTTTPTAEKIVLGDPQWISGGAGQYTLSNLKVDSTLTNINTAVITVDAGEVTLEKSDLGDIEEEQNLQINQDLNKKTLSLVFENAIGDSVAQSILQKIKYTYPNDAVEQQIAITLDGGITNVPKSATTTSLLVENNRKQEVHYYAYVPYKDQSSTVKFSWTEAYKAARQLSYMGMKGYLANITSEAEDTMLTNLSKGAEAWIGGTRVLFGESRSKNAEALDDANTDDEINALLHYEMLVDGGYQNVTSNEPADLAPLMYWADGPEVGEMVPSIYNNNLEYKGNWNDGEPNNDPSFVEAYMLANYNNGGWNDYPITSKLGYFVEFGGRSGETAEGILATVSGTVNRGVTITGYSGVYDGIEHGLTVSDDTDKIILYRGPNDSGFSSSSPQFKNAGTYTVEYEIKNSEEDSTPILTGSATVNITKAPLTVTANDKTISNGEKYSHNGVTYSGFVNGEDENTKGIFSKELEYLYIENGTNIEIEPYWLESDNYEITFVKGKLTILDNSNPSGGGSTGGSYHPPVIDKAVYDVETLIDAIGTVDLDKADEIQAARDAYDKLTESQQKKVENYQKLVDAEKKLTVVQLTAKIENMQLAARSKIVTLNNGKKAVRIFWYEVKDGVLEKLDSSAFDEVEVYRSFKRYGDYGKDPLFVSETDRYYNTAIKKGARYYYRVRGCVTVDDEKIYTPYSLKAWRFVK